MFVPAFSSHHRGSGASNAEPPEVVTLQNFGRKEKQQPDALLAAEAPLTAPGGSGVPAEERVPDHVPDRVSCPPHVPKCVCRAPTLQQLGSCLRAPVFFSRWPPKLLTSNVSFSV